MGCGQGDYLGFKFGSQHSSDFNITRVSSSDRYNYNLSPEFSNKTVDIPGGDGSYFFNTKPTLKLFLINVAFDNVNEELLNNITRWLNCKHPLPLIFDELPYKYYMAKILNPPQFKVLTFSEGDTGRVYKGEGSIDMIAFFPYARNATEIKNGVLIQKKYLNLYDEANKGEWADASHMSNELGEYDTFKRMSLVGNNTVSAPVYNAGDLDTDIKITLKPTSTSGSTTFGNGDFSIVLSNNSNNTFGTLGISKITAKGNEAYLIINTSTHLIEGFDVNNQKTGYIYNENILNGDFFKIPSLEEGCLLNITNYLTLGLGEYPNSYINLEYSFLYY